ncbi:MAG TPA: hypothetical protein PKY82_03555 [Pyrinomonadaceae bacterium]|nr:hypothetical protein [Pyrinomonadaceae bacterium]
MLTTLAKQVNKSVFDLFTSRRKADLSISISIPPNKGQAIRNLETGQFRCNESTPTLKVKTIALSKNSISFIVPSIRFNDTNLAGDGRVLKIELELPNGKVTLEVIGERYERIGKRTSLAEYMVEARIVYINPIEAEVYRKFLRNGGAASEAKGNNLVFGITER